ncbi:hypothetical protein JCM11251_003122 [Rhodosporidiobolus azoricus]
MAPSAPSTDQTAREGPRAASKKVKEPQTEHAKADQVIQHFYSKTLAVISQARLTHPSDSSPSGSANDSSTIPGCSSSVSTVGIGAGALPGGGERHGSAAAGTAGEQEKGKGKGKTNKWFNLELPDPPSTYRDLLRPYRSVSSLLSSAPAAPSPPSPSGPSPSSSGAFSPVPSPAPYALPPPPQENVPLFVLETLLDVSDLTPNQVLVLDPTSSSPSSTSPGKRIRVDSSFARRPSRSGEGSAPTSPPPPRLSGYTVPVQRASTGRAGSRPGTRGPGSPVSGGGAGGSGAPTVVLERWELRLLPNSAPNPSSYPFSSSPTATPDLSTVYKHSILHFRSLYTLVRALPAYGLYRRLAKRRAGVGGAGLKITVRLRLGAGGGAGEEGEVAVEVPIEDLANEEGEYGNEGEEEELEEGKRGLPTTEKIVFPGVVTPLGTLSLTCLYRLNTSFSVDEIETLLSSRFIDEDFFRPTVATRAAQASEHRPGSLPISSRVQAGTGGGGTRSPARASPPAGAFPPATAGMTGLGPLPSYGSLSSRHQYAPSHYHPHPPSPLSTSPALVAPVALPPSSVPPSGSPSPAATPATSYIPAVAPGAGPSSVSSSARFSGYAPPGTSVGASVEPAFISLSRQRGASFVSGSGIQRASPAPVPSPASPQIGIIRRTSLTGSSASGSPIFRPGSYIPSSAPTGAAGSGLSSSPSYSGYGPITRQQPISASPSSHPSHQRGESLVFGSRSPLTPLVAYSGQSMLGATAPASGAGAGGGGGVGVGIAIGGGASASSGYQGGAGGTPSSSSLGRGGAGPFGSAGGGGGSYVSRSYGRGSASASSGEVGPGWGGAVEGGAGSGAPGLVRRASSRLSFGAGVGSVPAGYGGGFTSGSPSSLGRSSSSRLAQIAAAHRAATSASSGEGDGDGGKKFLNQAPGEEPEDAEDINEFLGMLESRPDLKGPGLGASFAGGVGSVGGSRSVLMSKKDVDEQMRLLRSSFLGGAESPSPPSFGLAGGVGSLPRSVGPSGLSGISSLRKQTSRLSIEEDAAGEAEAARLAKERERERERLRSPSSEERVQQQQRPLSPSTTMTTPRATLRHLPAGRKGEIVSPSLSATSSSTVLPPLPPLSLGGDSTSQSPLSHAHNRLTEPRFFPLPTSSVNSPLASPGISRERDRDVLAAFALVPASTAQPYPPLPYPPAATTTTSTSTRPINLAPYYSSRSRSSSNAPSAAAVIAPSRAHAIRQPLAGEASSGFNTPARPGSNVGGSVSSFASSTVLADDVETDVEAAMSSYRADDGEVEAVGRLELDESPSEEMRGRRWPGVGIATSEGQAGDAALASAAAAAQAQASRDSTPAARGAGYFGAPPCPPMLQYAANRSRGGSRATSGERRASPPDISWMG